jgi:hypothetical protein
MNARELKQLLTAGPVVIEFGPKIEELETYAEPKMRAHLVSVSMSEADIAILTVDYTAFEELNKTLELANYYDKHGNAVLTAREAGQYTPQEDLYVDWSDLDGILSALPTATHGLFEEFKSSGQESYVNWLEEQLLAARAPA